MTPFRVTLALMLVMVAVLLAAGSAGVSGIIQATSEKNSTQSGTGTYWIKIDPIGDKHRGDQFILTSTTNLPVGDDVRIQIYSGPNHGPKNRSYRFYGIIGTAKVTKGSEDLNKTVFDVDSSKLKVDEYLVQEDAMQNYASNVALFNVLNATNQQYWIKINPIGDRKVGDKFTITATTNLSVGDEVLCEVHTSERFSVPWWGGHISQYVNVTNGDGGLNKTIFDVDLSGFRPDEMVVIESSEQKVATGSEVFNILDKQTPASPPSKTQSPVSVIGTCGAIIGAGLGVSIMKKQGGW